MSISGYSSTPAALRIMGISLAALSFALLGMGTSTLVVLGMGISTTLAALGIMGISLVALGMGTSTLPALEIFGICLAALGSVELDLAISFTPDGSTFASTVTTFSATFTSVAGSTASTLTAPDTFFLELVLLFPSLPPLEASFASSLEASFASS